MQLVFMHYVGFPCFDVFLQNFTKGIYTPMSFGFNVRCCTVLIATILYFTQTLNCWDGHYLCGGGGGKKIGGGKALLK